MIVACYLGHHKTIELFLKHGANANARTKRGLTPLHLAAKKGDIISTKLVVEVGGCDLGVRDSHGRSIFHYCEGAPVVREYLKGMIERRMNEFKALAVEVGVDVGRSEVVQSSQGSDAKVKKYKQDLKNLIQLHVCVVCSKKARNIVNVPCMHLALCAGCSGMLFLW